MGRKSAANHDPRKIDRGTVVQTEFVGIMPDEDKADIETMVALRMEIAKAAMEFAKTESKLMAATIIAGTAGVGKIDELDELDRLSSSKLNRLCDYIFHYVASYQAEALVEALDILTAEARKEIAEHQQGDK